MKILSWSFFIFAVAHLIIAPWAFTGRHPIIPIDDRTVEWEVANNEFILGIFFVWAGFMARLVGQNWSTRGRLELCVALGAMLFAIDGIYMVVRPMPDGGWWTLLSIVLAVFMLGNALVGFRALATLRANPILHGLPGPGDPGD